MKEGIDLKKALLAALDQAQSFVTAWTLLEMLEGTVRIELMSSDPQLALVELAADGLIERINSPGVTATWKITPKGTAKVVAGEAFGIFAECSRERRATAQATVCNVRNSPPNTALVCMDEDELDDWWNSLDAELKADAFTQFALHMYDGSESRVHVCPSPIAIPVAGVIGEESRATA